MIAKRRNVLSFTIIGTVAATIMGAWGLSDKMEREIARPYVTRCAMRVFDSLILSQDGKIEELREMNALEHRAITENLLVTRYFLQEIVPIEKQRAAMEKYKMWEKKTK